MQDKKPAPRIRQDLSLHPTEPDPDGTPAWILHDDVSGRYFRLGQQQMELLPFVDGSEAEACAAQAAAALDQEITVEDFEDLFEFLRHNNLVLPDQEQQVWLRQQRETKTGVFGTLIKSYLFFRVPLVRPDAFLGRTLPYVRWLGSAWVLQLLLLAALLGIVLVLQEFDSFKATFLYFFNPRGLVYFMLAMAVVKVLHELGHGYVAKSLGCKVSVMGVAFLVLWPVLYTDTSDAWRIARRKDRIKIDMAGVAVEMGVAVLALLAWLLTEEGILHSVFFVLATSTWLVSLGVNLNPLMRFDGYYILSDYWRIPNLEPRSQALARWWLREQLFGLKEPSPEAVQMKLVFFAIAVWIYRFLLFIGIALLVYHLFFKTLGIFLFVVEIYYFILGPIYREILQWHKRRQQLRWNRQTRRTTLVLGTLLLLFFIPWRTAISLPGILQAGYQVVYAPAEGRLELLSVVSGQQVEKGQLLFRMIAPELEFELEQAQRHLAELEWERAAMGFNDTIMSRALVTASEIITQQQLLTSLRATLDRLNVVAPESGYITDIEPSLREGMWVSEGEGLFALVNSLKPEVVAYQDEAVLARVATEQSGWFYPEGGGRSPIPVQVKELEYFSLGKLEQLYTASSFGGAVAVRELNDGELVPVEATYRVRLAVEESSLAERVLRGTVVLRGPAQSFASRTWRQIRRSLVKESGF